MLRLMPIADDVRLGEGVVILYPELANLYGCVIGAGTRVGPFVEIQAGVVIGERCKIQSHSFICSGVTIEDEVFVGHGVMFVNDMKPRAVNDRGGLSGPSDWQLAPIRVRRGVSIGSNATILGNVTVGASAMVGAGAVVTKDVPDYATVAGVPARELRSSSQEL
jgi:acetyltransferase-like isoleucine patch superfamily enzyme